jgi:uncharacterized protein with PQ loop repeat
LLLIDLLGTIGAICFALCALPQAVQVWRTQDTRALSLAFLLLWAGGEVCMWAYVLLDNMARGAWQWPLHANYAGNAVLLGYLLIKKVQARAN